MKRQLIVVAFAVLACAGCAGGTPSGRVHGVVIGKDSVEASSVPIGVPDGNGGTSTIMIDSPATFTLHLGWCDNTGCHTRDVDTDETGYNNIQIGAIYPPKAAGTK